MFFKRINLMKKSKFTESQIWWNGCIDNQPFKRVRSWESTPKKDVCRIENGCWNSKGSSCKKVVAPSHRKEMACWAVKHKALSIRRACSSFMISEACYRYEAKLSDINASIADWLLRLTYANKTWGFDLCFLYLRNVKGFEWNHKRVYRIYPCH